MRKKEHRKPKEKSEVEIHREIKKMRVVKETDNRETLCYRLAEKARRTVRS